MFAIITDFRILLQTEYVKRYDCNAIWVKVIIYEMYRFSVYSAINYFADSIWFSPLRGWSVREIVYPALRTGLCTFSHSVA